MRIITVFQKVLSGSKGKLYGSLKLKNVMSTWDKCAEKKQMDPVGCCEVKCLMDEMCHPEGRWIDGYNKKNIKDTSIMVAGIVTFTMTLIYMKITEFAKGHPDVTFF